ncbi:MAG TPA: hypothetical protein VMA98_01185 [Candidatus Acidoferrales bacterium]|nr:hypothetical protein [Candidatus Acidoferrales bacterium]
MRIPVPAMLVAVLLSASAATPAPLPTPTPDYPEIYHTLSRPLCSALETKIRPAIAMMMESDKTIAKSPPLFGDYIKSAANDSDAGQDMAVNRLNYLVGPLVQNTLAIQKMLEDPSVFRPDSKNEDDKALIDLKEKMLKALADQQASLDIINGFVATQQLGEMQHEGFGWLSSITGQSNTNSQNSPGAIPGMGQAPNSQAPGTAGASTNSQPLAPQPFDNLVLQAGLAPNQFEIDPTQIPGLAVGYNQIGKLKEGVEWTQSQAKSDENPLARAVIRASIACGAFQAPATPATPSPKP